MNFFYIDVVFGRQKYYTTKPKLAILNLNNIYIYMTKKCNVINTYDNEKITEWKSSFQSPVGSHIYFKQRNDYYICDDHMLFL